MDSTSMLLGEVRGQLREVIHTMNNLSMKVDSIGKDMGSLSHLAGQVETNKEAISKIALAVDALERDKDERAGATSIIGLVLKSPALGWLIGAALAVWALIKGVKV